jgi:uncharacterized pyridoxamine 5'-phosphate oxidase family protein
MAGYGIETSVKGLLPWRWASDRLTKTRNYLLTTVRADGRPHVMPLWGVWMDDRSYFSTGKTSVKARNLSKNANCVLCTDDAEEVVIVEGTAGKATDKTVLKKFGAAYKKKYKFDALSIGEPIFAIRPKVAFGQIEKTFPKTATRWKF